MSTTLYTEIEIKTIVKQIAEQIKEYKHEQPPVLICVLNGAFIFFADLVREIGDCEIDFIRVKSYDGVTQGSLKITKPIEISICNRDVFIVDDIYDSGNTMNYILNKFIIEHPKSLTPVILFKRYSSDTPENLIFGNLIKDEAWLYGYGLDGENGMYRNLKEIKGTHVKVD
jgi:hypoxanthine phosphoribosyltransferase